MTPFSEYPAKGRATGGVRCHRFLKGEDTLVFAWAGPAPGPRRGRQRRRRRPARGRPAGATAPGVPAASRSPPAPGRWSRPVRAASRRCDRLTRMLDSGLPRPRAAARSPPWSTARCARGARRLLRRRRGESADGRRPEEVLATAKKTLDDTSGRAASTLATDDLPDGRQRPRRGRRRRHPRARVRGQHQGRPDGQHRRRAGHRRRRQGLRQAAASRPASPGRSTRPTTAPPTRPR